MNKLRVAIITNVIAHYREAFYRELFQRSDVDVTVYCQPSIPGLNLKPVHHLFSKHVQMMKYIGLSREHFGWQFLPWRELLQKHDVFFVQGNPRVLSNIVFSCISRLAGKRVVIWGQAHTASANRTFELIRLCWWRCFKTLFVYTDKEAEWLRAGGFKSHRIIGMNNGLDQKKIEAASLRWNTSNLDLWCKQKGLQGRIVVLSCARLEPKNAFYVWIEAMPRVIKKHPNLLWCVVGEGVEGESLRDKARQYGVDGSILWLGSVSDEEVLAPWFLTAKLLVHPSAIGLTLLHAFGYGLPVITHDDADKQMPEYAAFVDGNNGRTYRYGDSEDLARVVDETISQPMFLKELGLNAMRVAREQYNCEVMADRFVETALSAV